MRTKCLSLCSLLVVAFVIHTVVSSTTLWCGSDEKLFCVSIGGGPANCSCVARDSTCPPKGFSCPQGFEQRCGQLRTHCYCSCQ
uniref:Putative secreted peptide n=1 Tax=Hyalomma excavatum TaxID=257692 RepID=A0A131XKN7_9ACAR